MKTYDLSAAKKPINLTFNSDLIEKARDLNINISKELETALIKLIKEKKHEQWLTESKEAISKYNQSIAKRGVFSEEWRRF